MSKIRYTEFFGKGKGFKKESICPSQKIFVEHYCDGTCQLTLHYITDKVHTQRGWHVCQYISVNPLDFLQHVPARPLSQIIYVHTNLQENYQEGFLKFYHILLQSNQRNKQQYCMQVMGEDL